MRTKRRLWALGLTGLFLTGGGMLGCAPHKPWRVAPVSGQPVPPPETSAWLPGTNGAAVIVVEFDDQGEMWSGAQRDFALTQIETYANEGPPLTVVVFVPGWHHSAQHGDSHLAGFQAVLNELAGEFKGRRWIGVYLGWRGESLDFPGLCYLTYWNRRSAAARVGGIPAASFFADLASIVQPDDKKRHDHENKNKNMLIVIGHSFGARVVETAVTNALPFDDGKPTLDLVVLLNEASEALRAKTAIDRFKSGAEPGRPAVAPQIVSITSKGDTATKAAFPAGQWVLSLGQRFQDYQEYGDAAEKTLLPPQANLFRHTAGHTEALWSHVLKLPEDELTWPQREDVTPFNLDSVLPGPRPDYLLVPVDRDHYNDGTPYWIIEVPQEIVLDHYDIFNGHLRGLLGGLIVKWFRKPEEVKAQRAQNFQMRKENSDRSRRSRTLTPENP